MTVVIFIIADPPFSFLCCLISLAPNSSTFEPQRNVLAGHMRILPPMCTRRHGRGGKPLLEMTKLGKHACFVQISYYTDVWQPY